MTSAATTPGLTFTIVPRPTEASPLRTDVAGFIGRTKRGLVGEPGRVEEGRGYLRELRGLLKDSSTTYAIRGDFENGGEVGYLVRICGEGSTNASAVWMIGDLDSNGQWPAGSPATFPFAHY